MKAAGKYSFERLAGDLPGAEGPVVDLQGRIFMVASNLHLIVEVRDDGTVRHHVHTGGTPAGLQVDQENNLWCADMEKGILRITPDGRIFPEVQQYRDQPIRGCNDCYFDSKGNLYFTAPAGSDADTPVGEVFCRLRHGKVVRLDDGYRFSNGLAVTADDTKLVVAETYTKQLWIYDIVEPGRLSDRRLLATLGGRDNLGPDGMDFDAEGLLLVTNVFGSSIEVLTIAGELVERITTPFTKPTNVHFAGPGSKTLLITECTTGALWRTTWRNCGQAQYSDLKLIHDGQKQ